MTCPHCFIGHTLASALHFHTSKKSLSCCWASGLAPNIKKATYPASQYHALSDFVTTEIACWDGELQSCVVEYVAACILTQCNVLHISSLTSVKSHVHCRVIGLMSNKGIACHNNIAWRECYCNLVGDPEGLLGCVIQKFLFVVCRIAFALGIFCSIHMCVSADDIEAVLLCCACDTGAACLLHHMRHRHFYPDPGVLR